MRAKTFAVAAVAAAILVGFVAFNVLAGAVVRGDRLDLTADRLYSLSPGVKPLLARLAEPVRLDLYYSRRGRARGAGREHLAQRASFSRRSSPPPAESSPCA
ncbi:MAG: hypothetical protein U0575_01125 [Phycisphaerales bacterium]